MMKNNSKSLKALAMTFVLSGVWDTVAGILYLFVIGTGRIIDNPATDPFYAVFIASFFFCFAYLQFISATNIKRYLFVVGSLIIGRLLYVILLYYFIFFVKDFPDTFFFTGIVDSVFLCLYFVFAHKSRIKFKELFLPKTKSKQVLIKNI